MTNLFEPSRDRTAKTDHRLSAEALELIAVRFKVLSEPSRLRLIVALRLGEKNVTELVAATGATQANVSRHLHTLTVAGILGRRKAGLNVYYAIVDPTVFDLCEHVCASLQNRLALQSQALAAS